MGKAELIRMENNPFTFIFYFNQINPINRGCRHKRIAEMKGMSFRYILFSVFPETKTGKSQLAGWMSFNLWRFAK